jgi:hypothetical protein
MVRVAGMLVLLRVCMMLLLLQQALFVEDPVMYLRMIEDEVGLIISWHW